MNLFDAIEGRRSEDLATQILLFVLESSAFRELQRLFYERILRDGVLLSTEARRFRVATQESDPKLGRPDLKIEGEEALIILENKFSALFTPNQLPRYVELLINAGKATSVLVLVCPNHMRTQYQQHALLQFAALGTEFRTFDELQKHFLTKRISLLVITWEELLRLLDSANLLVVELVSFIRDRFLVHVEFTANEVQRIMSTQIPDMLQKIFTLVGRVKGEIEGNEMVAGRSSQSLRYWGFPIYKNGRCFDFGYMFDYWSKYETPVFLRVQKGLKENEGLEEEQLTKSNMQKEKEGEFLFPIRLEVGDETAALGIIVRQIQAVIDRVCGSATNGHAATSPAQS